MEERPGAKNLPAANWDSSTLARSPPRAGQVSWISRKAPLYLHRTSPRQTAGVCNASCGEHGFFVVLDGVEGFPDMFGPLACFDGARSVPRCGESFSWKERRIRQRRGGRPHFRLEIGLLENAGQYFLVRAEFVQVVSLLLPEREMERLDQALV